MGDRQRNFAQYATALNQFASFNNDGGGAERGGRERGDGGGGVTAPGSNSSGSSGSGGASHGGTTAAGNAALWGELSRSLQYNNYPGFSSAWQGSSGDMRLYGYGGYGEGQVDGRPEARSESRVEGRRVPSKGETKATPPLPPGMAPGVGSALASLQQLVASGGDAATVYRSLLAARQYAAAAAALGAIPTPSSINPAALHAASPLTTHHQQQQQQQQRRQQHQQQHHQQQQLQHHQQQQHQQQQHQHQHQQLQQQQAAALVTANTAGLNGEGLAMHNASRMQQASPQDRKFTSAVPTELRHDDPQPSPGRTRSHALPTSVNSQEVICPSVKGKEANEVPGVDGSGDGGSDGRRVQSGSESEGDQRTRHRRKQEQPRRQSVIYPVTAQPEGGGGGGGDSSSDDSQGFDVLMTRSTVDHRDSPHDSLHSNSPADPALRLPPSREAFSSQGMSQAMSHALAHPFLAAHLNPSQLLQMAQPPTTGKADVPSPHSQPVHQLQVRTDLLEPHPKEPESYPIQEPQRPLSRSQITTQEIEINRVRTPPSNTSVDGTTAPVKKRRCSPRYLENDTSVSDPLGNSTISEVERSDRGENSVTSVSVSLSGEDSTAHNVSPSIESTPVNGINAISDDMLKNASSSNSNSHSLVNISTENCEADNVLQKNLGKNDQDYFNGDHEMFDNPRKSNRKRKSESDSVTEMDYQIIDGQLEECGDTKRRTRQKRAVSYVEDGTDPVLEMNEDSSPDATPLKKKGRRSKDLKDRLDGESNPSPEQQVLSEPPSSPPTISLEDSPGKSSNNSPTGCKRGRGVFRGAPRGRGRTLLSSVLGTQEEKYPSVTEPLHVDTTLITEPDLRVPGPPPIAPTSCSPDVYDFNDTDSDGVCRGKKGKRGRKKGSSPKKNTKSPLEIAKASISPRPREAHVKSPRSPKFFSSSRSPVTERNKEWHQGVSPPVRDFLKTLADIPVSESTAASSLLQESVTEINRAGQLSEDSLVQDSQSGDTQASDTVAKTDADVVSPRRSSRRNKNKDSQETITAKGNESVDSNLSNLPSPPSGNSKNNTSFSGLISGTAQSKEDKEEKSSDIAAPGPLPVDGLGSPSSRIRKRGRRSGDQLHSEQQIGVDETQTVPTPEKIEPKSLLESPKLPEESKGKCEIDTVEPPDESVVKVEAVPEDRLNSSVDKEVKALPTKSVGIKIKGKGRGKGKKRNAGRSSKGKSAQKKNIVSKVTSVLPHETKQYQLVPENAFDDNKAPSGMITTEGEHSFSEDKSLIQESSTNVPASTFGDTTKSDSTQHKSRTKSGTDINLVQSNPLAVDGTSDEPDMESSSQNPIEETTSVIAQRMEETESRGRRLRTRRASAKQESKSETQDTKSEIQDAKLETKDAKSEAQDTKPETQDAKSEAQDEKSETQDAKSEVQETDDIRLETQDARLEIQDVQPESQDVPTETLEAKSETQEGNSKSSSTDLVAQETSHISEISLQSEDVSTIEPSITAVSTSVVPENPSSMSVAPSETLEVPQGTDMDVDAETVENIAKFLEETASSIPAATEETYVDKRPKRSSRPPRKMDENEMNDLLMLLNMEDEESEDEDYVPKDLENSDSMAESDEGGDSEGIYDGEDYESDSSDDCENESRGGNLSNLLNMASDATVDNDFVPIALKHGKGGPAKQKGLKKDKGRKVKVDASSAKKGKIMKGKVKSNKSRNDEVDLRKKSEEGRRKGEVCERRGPFIRLDASRFREVIVNTPYRDDDEQEKPVRKNSIHFYCKIEAKQKTAKVGYNSTLHNNYDAFSKDTSWYCSLCKNYSHSRKLGDLYGPYFIEGLTLLKKQYPQVVEGQVVESSSPSEVGKLKKRTQRRESTSDGPLENRKLELGGSSPPWRFVPAATPARMLGRPAAKEGGPQQTPDHPNSVSPGIIKDSSVKEVVSEENPATSTTPAVARPPGTECWVHEICLLWAPGVHVSNSRLCGLEEAVILAQDSVCSSCSETGATVACLGKGCSLMVHVPCATQLQWTLDQHTFKSLCPKHTKLT
ncbi:uncharacterized protein [Panulirus ornatus]